MSTPLRAVTNPQRPASTEQTPPAAPARPVGIGETPSSLCCLGGDANDSIFSRIWTTITSLISSVWACLTGWCFSPGSAARPAARVEGAVNPAAGSTSTASVAGAQQRQPITPIFEQFRANVRGTFVHLFDPQKYPIEATFCKAVLVCKLTTGSRSTTPYITKELDTRIEGGFPRALKNWEDEANFQIYDFLSTQPIDAGSRLKATLILFEKKDSGEFWAHERKDSVLTSYTRYGQVGDTTEGQEAYLTSEQELEQLLTRVFGPQARTFSAQGVTPQQQGTVMEWLLEGAGLPEEAQ